MSCAFTFRQECLKFIGNYIKFIRNYIRDPSGVFSLSSLVRILMTSFPAFAWLAVPNGER